MSSKQVEAPSDLGNFWKSRQDFQDATKQSLTIVTESGEPLDGQEAVDEIAAHLQSLWTAQGDTTLILDPLTTQLTAPPTKAEVQQAINNLKRNKAIGMDKISPNTIIDDPTSADTYAGIFQAIWTTGEIPQCWKDMKIKPIPKQATTCTSKQVRPITCVSTSTKILNSLIASRYQADYDNKLQPVQHAYRKGHSIWTAKQQLLHEISQRPNCAVAFLDLSKAFDKVNRRTLRRCLKLWNLPQPEFNIILQQYVDAYAHVELNGKKATPFVHEVGIRQGCTLSGMIFNLATCPAVEKLKGLFTNYDYAIVNYSDDYIIIANDMLTIKVLCKALEECLADTGLTFNQDKKRIILFNTSTNHPDQHEWLGTIFTSNLDWQYEVNARITRGKEASLQIQTICRQQQLRIPTEYMVKIIQSLVSVHLNHPQDIITLTVDQKRQLTNYLQGVILTLTRLNPEEACNQAEILLGFAKATIPSQGKRKLFQSKDKPPLPNVKLEGPDKATQDARRLYITRLQQERHWCTVCIPHKYYRDITRHRQRTHQLGLLPRLNVYCQGCKRNLDSVCYWKHICLSNQLTSAMLPCRYCGSMYDKHGLARHIATCTRKQIEFVSPKAGCLAQDTNEDHSVLDTILT